MARTTLTPPPPLEPKTYAEIAELISEALSAIPGAGTVPAKSVCIVKSHENSDFWGVSLNGHGVTDAQIKLLDTHSHVISELQRKYRVV